MSWRNWRIFEFTNVKMATDLNYLTFCLIKGKDNDLVRLSRMELEFRPYLVSQKSFNLHQLNITFVLNVTEQCHCQVSVCQVGYFIWPVRPSILSFHFMKVNIIVTQQPLEYLISIDWTCTILVKSSSFVEQLQVTLVTTSYSGCILPVVTICLTFCIESNKHMKRRIPIVS